MKLTIDKKHKNAYLAVPTPMLDTMQTDRWTIAVHNGKVHVVKTSDDQYTLKTTPMTKTLTKLAWQSPASNLLTKSFKEGKYILDWNKEQSRFEVIGDPEPILRHTRKTKAKPVEKTLPQIETFVVRLEGIYGMNHLNFSFPVRKYSEVMKALTRLEMESK